VKSATVVVDHPELGEVHVSLQVGEGSMDVQATTMSRNAAAILRASEANRRAEVEKTGVSLRSMRVDADENERDEDESKDPRGRRRPGRYLDREA
jgi:flagellar hook-length control protein FliK